MKRTLVTLHSMQVAEIIKAIQAIRAGEIGIGFGLARLKVVQEFPLDSPIVNPMMRNLVLKR